MAGNEGTRAAGRRVGGFESAGEVARRALRLDPAERVYGSKLHSPARSSNFRKKSESGTSSDGRSRRSLRGFSADRARCTFARPRGLSSAGERICAARSKPTQRRPAQSIRRSKPPALRSWQRQSGRCAHCANRRGQTAGSTVRYFPPDFRRAIAAQRADESASAVAARPAISDSVSTTALFIASVASFRPERTTGNATSAKSSRSRKIPVQLANRQWFPDPTLDVQTQRYNQAGQAVSELDVGVSIGLPFLNPGKYSATVTEARRNFESARHELEATRTETLGLVRDQLKKIETAAHHYELYSDKILPLARQAVQSNRVAYETSSANFLELITAQRVLQDVESTHVNHLADYQVAVAELDAIVGIDDWRPSKNFTERRKSK